MVFTSLDFLIFLAIVFPLHWLLFSGGRRAQNLFLLAASYVFYGWWDTRFVALMMLTSLADYAIARRIAQAQGGARKAWLAVSLAANFGVLGFFKYFLFFTNALWAQAPWAGWAIILPVGVSFYTFQAVSYTIDVYRGRPPAQRLEDFLVYVAFFPHLVAGPIQRAGELLVQLEAPRRLMPDRLSLGLRYMLWGFFKKLVVGDNCAALVDTVFADGTAQGPVLWLGLALFSFQIYADFSGYSDIAVGVAHLFGVRLGQNFRYPYLARNPQEFWQRWHISLSTWFRDYLYIPLGGNRYAKQRNILLTFLASGFWHGANWTFLWWGVGHGVLYLLWTPSKARPAEVSQRTPFTDTLRRLALFTTVSWLWVLFRSPNLGAAVDYTARAFRPGLGWPAAWNWEALWCAAAGIAIMLVVEWLNRRRPHPCEQLGGQPLLARHAMYGTLAVAIYLLGNLNAGYDFIYFQF